MLQSVTRLITNCYRYYTKCDHYYNCTTVQISHYLWGDMSIFFLFVEPGSGVTMKTKRKCLGSILPSFECYASMCVLNLIQNEVLQLSSLGKLYKRLYTNIQKHMVPTVQCSIFSINLITFFCHNDPNKLFSGLKRPWIKLRQLWERRYSYPHVRESRQVPGRRGIFAYGTWNPGLWNPEYGLKKIWNPLTIGIRNAIPGIRLLHAVPRLSWIFLHGTNEW